MFFQCGFKVQMSAKTHLAADSLLFTAEQSYSYDIAIGTYTQRTVKYVIHVPVYKD